ncbi:hypothetical protein SGM_4681 [Streptomyces griseoaurantiacus M045]|uniref:Uncharacterized protein n=1 Tax=Streptomyces griseoaurantiacus M045 TaxID=996637 RepID=F3NNG7_9ACTN|nr:hypothetical protein SGM_4681 [Streptomyces griseoaurantiacus M045]
MLSPVPWPVRGPVPPPGRPAGPGRSLAGARRGLLTVSPGPVGAPVSTGDGAARIG